PQPGQSALEYDHTNDIMYYSSINTGGPGIVAALDEGTSTQVGVLHPGNNPSRLALDSANSLLYVSNQGDDSVSALSTTPPRVTSTSPADGAQDVSPDTSVTATFSEPVQATTVNPNSFTLCLSFEGCNPIAGTVTLSQDGMTGTFKPTNLLSPGSYVATITTEVRD